MFAKLQNKNKPKGAKETKITQSRNLDHAGFSIVGRTEACSAEYIYNPPSEFKNFWRGLKCGCVWRRQSLIHFHSRVLLSLCGLGLIFSPCLRKIWGSHLWWRGMTKKISSSYIQERCVHGTALLFPQYYAFCWEVQDPSSWVVLRFSGYLLMVKVNGLFMALPALSQAAEEGKILLCNVPHKSRWLNQPHQFYKAHHESGLIKRRRSHSLPRGARAGHLWSHKSLLALVALKGILIVIPHYWFRITSLQFPVAVLMSCLWTSRRHQVTHCENRMLEQTESCSDPWEGYLRA